MKRIRLLVLGPLPPPAGGVETVTRAVLDSNAFADFEVHHCDTTKKRSKDTQGRFDLGNLVWAGIHFARMTAAVLRFRPHVVYMPLTATWSGFWRDAVLASIAKCGRAKVIAHVHGSWLDRILAARGTTERMVRFCLTRFDALLMLGDHWKQMICGYGYAGKVRIVPSTFERPVFEAGEDFARDYAVAEPHGLFVGQLGRGKGVLDLLHALARIKAAGAAPRFTLVGGPQFSGDWEAILRLRDELGLTQLVEMTGILLGNTLYERFRRADYFVLPSYYEGLPIVLLEAGCFGLPVITTAVGSVPDLIRHESNGLLVTAGNVAELQRAIERLRGDAPVRERFGVALKRSVLPYHPDAICRKIAAVVSQLAGVDTLVEGLTDADRRGS
jgi:glycosyltransferase involved in cell wall biosynthesis